ncbi:MAG TPA: hypothetical protein DCS19_02245 [Flavobacterium sp.]|nr:hypothetical protein [Flavobacterium sp.]
MVAPLINIFRTKEEAFYFKNSYMNNHYDFSGVHLLPNNAMAYVQVTDTPNGINLEDWTVNIVDLCKETKVDITDYFMVEVLTNARNGEPQFYWSLTNVPFDFGYNMQYLEITQTIGETFYSTPFLLTNEESEKVSQFHYKEKRADTYQSISFKAWYRSTDKKTELTTYYETSTRHTVTKAIKTNVIETYKTDKVSIDSLIQLSDVLESPYLYVNTIRASLFQAIDLPKPKDRENYGQMDINLSFKKGDSLFGLADYNGQDYNGIDYKV